MQKQQLVRSQVLLEKADKQRFERAAAKIEKGSLSQLVRRAMREFVRNNPKMFR